MSTVRRRGGLAVLLSALAAWGWAAPAPAGRDAEGSTIDVRELFPRQVAVVKRRTSIPVLLPRALPWDGRLPRLHLRGVVSRERWSITLAAAPDCGRSTACFIASFEAVRGGRLLRTNLRLAGGQRARYLPIRCGASCGPATLRFVAAGVLYDWRLKEPPPGGARAFARLAAEALASRRR